MEQEYQSFKSVQAIKVTLVKTENVLKKITSISNKSKQSRITGKEKYPFPTPEIMKTNDRSFFCSSARIISLYNKAHCEKRQKLTATVQNWFKENADRVGWDLTEFLTESHTKAIAGCMLTNNSSEWRSYEKTQ